MIKDAPLRRLGKGEVVLIAGVEVEDRGLFCRLDIGNSVSIDGRGRVYAQRRQVATIAAGAGQFRVLDPRLLCQVQQTPVAGSLVNPEHVFYIGHVADGPPIAGLVVQVMLAQSLERVGILTSIERSGNSAEEDGVRPAMEVVGQLL